MAGSICLDPNGCPLDITITGPIGDLAPQPLHNIYQGGSPPGFHNILGPGPTKPVPKPTPAKPTPKPPPVVAPPVPVTAPPPPATMNEAIAQLGPVAAAIAPFAFAADQVAPSLQSGEELLGQLLAKEYIPGNILSPFEELLAKVPALPQTEFEQLLAKPLTGSLSAAAQSATEISISRSGASILSRLLGVLGGPVVAGLQALLYSQNAGDPNEAAIVAARLAQPGAAPPSEPSVTGLPGIDTATAPADILPPVVVSAPRAASPVATAPAFDLTPFALGDLPLPGAAPLVQPQTGRTPAASGQPAPFQQTVPLTSTLATPVPTATSQEAPGAAIAQSPLPTPQTAAQNQPDKCQPPKKQKQRKKPRTKCYKGSYVDRKHGLLKYPREEIKCQ